MPAREMANRIKEQMDLFSDRLSSNEMKGHQMRLYFSAQVDTVRLRRFKIGALVRIRVRRVRLQFSSACPWKDIFAAAFHALRS